MKSQQKLVCETNTTKKNAIPFITAKNNKV